MFQTIAIAIEKVCLETLKDNYYEKSFTVYYELLRKEKHYASSLKKCFASNYLVCPDANRQSLKTILLRVQNVFQILLL